MPSAWQSSLSDPPLLQRIDPDLVAAVLTALAWLCALLGVLISPFFFAGILALWKLVCSITFKHHPRPVAACAFTGVVLMLAIGAAGFAFWHSGLIG